MANLYDQFDAPSEVKDLATSFGVGSNQLLKMAGDVYGLASGNMDNVVSRQGQENIDYLQRGKSQKLIQSETRRKAAVDMEKGTLNQALAYVRETFTDPRLFLSTTVEALPSMVGAGAVGAGARVATGKVLAKMGAEKAAETATKVGVGTAVAAGAGGAGASVGADQYKEIVELLSNMPEDQALKVPQIVQLVVEKNATLEEAKTALALDLARSTGALATMTSAATQLMPGGRTIEKALVGGVGKKIAGSALTRAGVGAIGEGAQEAVEGASGEGVKNLLARAVDPKREITKGMGEAMGAGFAGAGPIGAAAGASSRPSRPVLASETTAGMSSEPLASDAIPSETRTSTTDTPDLSLEGAGEMNTREVGSVLSARESSARGFTPDPSDIATAESVRRPQIAESEEATKAAIAPVQEALDEWRTQNPDVGVNISVINDPNMRNTRNYGIRGYFDPNTGEVVINSAFTKPFEVESVVNHEWSHHTLSSEEGRSALVEFATRDIPKEELDALAKRYPNADNLTLVEEWIARSQETSPGTFARIIAKIREWLNGKLGINMTNEEVARVMLRTLRERGAPVAEGSGEMRQTTTEQPLDTASENLNKTPNEATSIQQEEPRPARALPKSRFYVSSDERGGDFAGAIAETARLHKKGAAVEVKSPEFYSDPENHLYFSEDGLAGAVVKPDGDLVSVFKHPDSTAKMRDILTDASQEATKLDGFDIDEFLPNYYSRFGFRPVARVTFNDDFAPPKWNFEENGRPDNVFMVRDPENKLGLPEYDAYSEVRDSVPLVSYEEALKLQQEAIDKVASEKPKGAVLASEKPSVSGQSNVLSPSSTDTVTMKPFKYSVEDEPKAGSKKAVRTPNEAVRKLSDDYNAQMGLGPIKHGHYVNFDEATARKIAKAYDAMPEIDRSPETVKAYEALAKEVNDQWDFAVENLGINFEPWNEDGQPYANSREMMEDVRNNNHLYFFRGGGKHEFMSQVDPETGLTSIDKLRAIHDLYGHAAEDYQFGPRGEENAWLKHSQMFSPEAQRALSVGTRGQNSWVNFGDQNYENGVNKNIPAKDRPYAPQKMALLPEELTDWRSALGQSEPERSSVLAKQPIRESVTEEPVGPTKKQTESPEFKKWFEVSKVVNEDGTPKVMFHSTTAGDVLTAFKRNPKDVGFHFGTAGQAEDRFNLKLEKDPYGPNLRGVSHATIPVFLRINRPLRMQDLGNWSGENIFYALKNDPEFKGKLFQDSTSAEARDAIKAAGYDGIVYANTGESEGASVYRKARDEAWADYQSSDWYRAQQAKRKPSDRFPSEEMNALPEYQAYQKASEAERAFRESNPQDSYIAFDPNQVKSATGNTGAFDPKKKDIRYSVTEEPVGQTKKQTESTQFKNWFGDWQDPKAFTSRAKGPVSQVFKDGKPLVVYHATTKDFDSFESGRPTFDDMGIFGNVETNRHAIFFSDSPEQAGSYVVDSKGRVDTGARTIPAYLDMKSPLYLNRNTNLDDLAEETGVNYNWLQNRRSWWELLDGEDGKMFVEGLKKAGYDGVVFEEDPIRPGVEVGTTYAVFEPSQIKSATGNRGTFDPTNTDIRYSVTDKPVGETALEDAKTRTFKNQIEVSKYLGDLLKKEFPNGLDGRSSEDRANLADMFDRELSLALTIPENADAIGWYSREMQKVFEVLRSPELDFKLDDPTNRGIFNAILAVTSNGQKVVPQFLKTAQLYEKWLETGKIPPVGKWGGERNKAIKGHLKFLNQLIEAVGPEQTVGFLTSEQSLGEHLTNLYGMVAEVQNLPADASVADQKAAVKKYLKTTMPSGELVDYNTVGAAVLGPKLGGGFFANLYGKFDRLTMDRWFMRTFHRLTGRLGLQRTDTIEGVLQEARSEAADVLPEDVSDEEILQEINTTGKQAFRDYKSIKKRLNENPDDTEALSQDLMRRLYNRYTKARSGLFDAPDNGGHRNFIRDVVNDVQKLRADRGEKPIDTSDIQAILWYLEKDLWNQLRKNTKVDEVAEADAQTDEDAGDAEDTAGRVSYSDGARELYRQKTRREFQFKNEPEKNQLLRRE